jgi:hypothetical protein
MDWGPATPILALGMVFFGVMIAVGIVRAYKMKEKAYYISASISGLMLMAMVSVFLFQFVVSIVFFAVAVIISLAGFTRIREAFFQEAVTQSQKTNVSKPFRVRDIFTWTGWFKLAVEWGTHRALCAYLLFNVGIIWLMFSILSIFIGIFGLVYAIVFTPIVLIISVAIFYRQIGENLRTSS